jgi:hypothetical protein
VIKPEMQQRYQMEKKNWFPRRHPTVGSLWQEDAWFV